MNLYNHMQQIKRVKKNLIRELALNIMVESSACPAWKGRIPTGMQNCIQSLITKFVTGNILGCAEASSGMQLSWRLAKLLPPPKSSPTGNIFSP